MAIEEALPARQPLHLHALSEASCAYGGTSIPASEPGHIASLYAFFRVAGNHRRCGALTVERGDARQARPDTIQKVAVNGVRRFRKAITSEPPFSRNIDQASPAQISKMPRHGGLREAENQNDVADAEIPGGKHVQDAQAHGVGESAEQAIDPAKGLPKGLSFRDGIASFHIWLSKYDGLRDACQPCLRMRRTQVLPPAKYGPGISLKETL